MLAAVHRIVMTPRLVYVSASTLPSSEANAVHVALMCDSFAGLGCDVTLRAARGSDGDVASLYALRNTFRIRYETSTTHRLWRLGRTLASAFSKAPGTYFYGRRLTALSRLARCGYATGVELHHPPRSAVQSAALQGFLDAPGFRGLVVISEQLRGDILKRFAGLDPSRVLVAHDGVRSDRIRPPQRHDRPVARAVYCGSFHSGKGIETLLPGAALIPEVSFDVIGGEPAQIAALKDKAPANVTFLGRMPHDECQRRLPDYDIALAPYSASVHGAGSFEHENFAAWMSPLKLFEYMGAGLPIVTTDLPVLREVLQDGESALMPPPDDPAAFARAVSTLARDPGLRVRMARAAQERLQGHTWENRAARILEFLSAGRAD